MIANDYVSIPYKSLEKYLQSLVGRFFKIIPMWENGEASLLEYMKGFETDLIGSERFLADIDNDGRFVSLLSTLEFLMSNQDAEFALVKKMVFNAISICNALEKQYCAGNGGDSHV